MENELRRNENGDVMNGLKVMSGFDADFFFKALEGKPVRNLSLDEVRQILNRALGDKSFYDYIREERDER